MIGPGGICTSCLHFEMGEGGFPVCAAFPGGIPDEVLHGMLDHRYPIDGDNDIQFELNTAVSTPEQIEQISRLAGHEPPDE